MAPWCGDPMMMTMTTLTTPPTTSLTMTDNDQQWSAKANGKAAVNNGRKGRV